MRADQRSSDPSSEAAAAIEKLEELRKTIKPGGLDWEVLRYTGGLSIDQLVHKSLLILVYSEWEILQACQHIGMCHRSWSLTHQ